MRRRPKPARRDVLRSLDRGVASGKLTEEQRDAAVGRLRFTTDLGELADRQMVIEAVVEDEALKVDVFRGLDKVVTDPQAILATNTSSIPIMKLGIATARPEQVVGIHFFNPVPVLRLVELVTSLLTSPETAEDGRAVRHRAARQERHPQPGPGRLRRQRPARAVPAVGDPDDGVGLRHRGGHRHRHGRGLQPPDGTAAPVRPDRARHDARRCAEPLRGVQGAPLRAATHAVADGRGRACSAASRVAAGSTSTVARAHAAAQGRLVAKVGLDGHDRGVKVVARILRDAGYEVIYTGLFQTPDTVAAAAVDEDVDAIGLSMLSGAHMTLAPLVVEKVRARGSDIPVIVGGIVPDDDVPKLLEAGVAGVLTPGATGEEVVAVVRGAIAARS